MDTKLIKIGALAKRCGLSVETLRFYEQQGLLKPAKRNSSGYRLYHVDDIKPIRFIIQAKKLGFTLNEIKDLLSINLNKDEFTCNDVKVFTAEKIHQVEEKISDLNNILSALKQLYNACCGGEKKATHCSILSALENQSEAKPEHEHE